MKKYPFLITLKKRKTLQLIEPSPEVSLAYLEKSRDSLRAASVLINANLLSESVSMAYYAAYHCIVALFMRCGIKCENHTGTIMLLDVLFQESPLATRLLDAKKERVDKQYYTDYSISKEEAQSFFEEMQQITLDIKTKIERLQEEQIKEVRDTIQKM